MSEYWMIWFYNELDGDFGCDPGAQPYKIGLEPAVAKAIARHMNKVTPEFVTYYAEPEPTRYW